MEESLKLFLKNGFSDVSLSEIKQSSNITTGGFYHYFQSKDDLLIEVIETYIFDYFKSTMLRLRKCTGTPQDKLKIVMLSLIGDAHLSDSVIIDYRTLHMLLMEGVKKFKPVSEKYSEFYNSLLDFILEVVEEGIDQGTIRNDIDPVELATSIETTMVGNILMGIALPEIPLKTRVNITIGCIWEFISLNHTA